MTFRRPSTPSSTQTEEEKKMSLLSRIGLWVDLSGFWLTRATWRYVSLHHILIFSPFVTTSRILMSSDYVLVWLLLVNFFFGLLFSFLLCLSFSKEWEEKVSVILFHIANSIQSYLLSIFQNSLKISVSYELPLLFSRTFIVLFLKHHTHTHTHSWAAGHIIMVRKEAIFEERSLLPKIGQ